jgi:hypothetical protein
MEPFKLNLPSLPPRDEEQISADAQSWAEMSLAFDHLRAKLAKLGDPDEVIRIRRRVTKFLDDTADGIDGVDT